MIITDVIKYLQYSMIIRHIYNKTPFNGSFYLSTLVLDDPWHRKSVQIVTKMCFEQADGIPIETYE